MNDRPVPMDGLRFQEACDWFVQLREQPESMELIAGWLTWCKSDYRNRQAFEEVRDTWLTLGLMPKAQPQGGTATADCGKAALPGSRGVRLHGWRTRMAVAAAVLVMTAGLVWLLGPRSFSRSAAVAVTTFATARSEHRRVALADGSSVDMAGDSKIRVIFGASSRDVDLQQGEAYFSVAHEKSRPFVVHTAALHVRAVGTRFDVRTTADRVVVAVEEGVVVVEPPESPGPIHSMMATLRSLEGRPLAVDGIRPFHVRGGQEVAVGMPDQQLQVSPIEPAAVASWREGRLRFAREPLDSVIANIRAVSGQEIVLADPGLGELRFTGTVFSSAVGGWVQALPAIFPVTVHQDGTRFIITHRDDPRN